MEKLAMGQSYKIPYFSEETIVPVLALNVQAGVPSLLLSQPGAGKTSMARVILEFYGYGVVELVGNDLEVERVRGYPVPLEGKIVYLPDELLSRLRKGAGLVLSDVTTAPPETLNALLEFIRVGLVVGERAKFPIILSANPEEYMTSGSPLGPALANRVGIYGLRVSPYAQVKALEEARKALLGGFRPSSLDNFFTQVEEEGWRRLQEGGWNLPPKLTEEDIPLMAEAAALALEVASKFLRRQAGYEELSGDVLRDSRPFFSRRSFSMAISVLATFYALRAKGWKGDGYLPAALSGIIGEGYGSSLALMALEGEEDIPDPEEVLADPTLFPPDTPRGIKMAKAILALAREGRASPQELQRVLEHLAGLNREVAASFFASAKKAGISITLPSSMVQAFGSRK
jgi:MoxR-like ATPase